jgi:large subunit ribosomal protein L3
MKAIFGRKVGMTRIFTDDGRHIPVTVLELGPNIVQQVKTKDNEKYDALQIGFGEQKSQRLTRAQVKHFAKAQKGIPKFVGEIRLNQQNAATDDAGKYNLGDAITLEGMFEVGNRVDIVGTSIGKGYAGVMKRHKMAGFTSTHGTHEYFRHGGSIGCRKFPGRVFKNKRMSGHMGAERVIQLGLEVMGVRPEENVLLVKGSVPGSKDSIVFVRQAVKGQ